MSMENVIDHKPSIDWGLSVKLANNNKELAKELLEMFITDLPNASDRIHQAYDRQDYEELQNQVHKLHGASCYCGVSKLKEILSQMEFSLKEKMLPQFEKALTSFDEEVNNILTAYKFEDYI